MDNQKVTKKCVKCQKEFSQEEGKETKKGFICSSCSKKAKKKYWLLVLLLLIVASGVYGFVGTQKSKVETFEGLTNVQDSVKDIVQAVPTFKLDQATAVSNSVDMNNAVVENIESFRREIKEKINMAKDTKSEQISIPSIGMLFNFDSSQLKEEGKNILQEFTKFYSKTNKKAIILVEGYTCNIGSDNINYIVSKDRAESVKKYLVDNGIDELKIETKWYGEGKYKEFNYQSKKNYRRVNVSIK